MGFGSIPITLICTYCDPVKIFITEIFAGLTFHFYHAGLHVDPRRSSNIHIRDRIVILSTMLRICIEYDAPDIHPLHDVVLVELPVLIVWVGISRILVAQSLFVHTDERICHSVGLEEISN